jgi:hypothetical protein
MNSDRNGGRKAAYRFPPQYALAGIAFAGFLIRLAGFFGPRGLLRATTASISRPGRARRRRFLGADPRDAPGSMAIFAIAFAFVGAVRFL